MTYYPDLSEYAYSPSAIPDLNVGWLARWHRYTKGEVSADFLAALARQASVTRSQTRGFHPCPFCRPWSRKGGEEGAARAVGIRLGSAEMHAFSRDGRVFAAPNLVHHYVDRHGYRPPTEFVEAVLDVAEGRIGPSIVPRLREVLTDSTSVQDRVDAAVDLMQLSPDSTLELIAGIAAEPACHPYLKRKLELLTAGQR
ncbi:hypothetical protein [Kitasatospora sp. LaBMicrA B282]|uniref:DUF7919 family protein n=1 Tax=Kitasatospora sp. LaBMicrA B282 TaxID=3420949 RepID=UPI003D11E6C8